MRTSSISPLHLLAFFLILVIGLRFAILLSSQSQVDGDEAVIGIMAQHIQEGKSFPIFFYGQPYGGGAALEAYLALIPYALFGISSISLKLVSFVLFGITLFLVFYWVKDFWGELAAILAVVILASSSALIEWSSKVRGGYSLLLLLQILLWIFYTRIVFRPTSSPKVYIGFGFLVGLSYYNHELSLSLLLTLFLATLYNRKSFYSKEKFVFLVLGFLGGVSPLIYYNLTHDMENWRNIFDLGSGGSVWWGNIKSLPTYLLGFFNPRNVDRFVVDSPWDSYLEMAIYAFLFCFLLGKVFLNRKNLSEKEGNKGDFLVPWLILYIFIHLFSYSASQIAHISPRYLLPLYPTLGILIAITLSYLYKSKHQLLSLVSIFLFCFLVGRGLWYHISYLGSSRVVEDVYMPSKKMVNLEFSGASLDKLLDFLEQKQIRYVRCPYFLQWRIIFASQEKIIASSEQFIPGLSRYPEYDLELKTAFRFAFVVYQGSYFEQSFREHPDKMIAYDVAPYVVFIPR